MTTTTRRAQLKMLTDRFFDAWARHDLDALMAQMAPDAVYDEFTDNVRRGPDEVREGFLPQCRGDYGNIQFNIEDIFIDDADDKALVRWLCTFQWKGTHREWRGLDILHFRPDGLISHKLTYAKTERPRTTVRPLDTSP